MKETNPELWERIKREAEAAETDPYEVLKDYIKAHPDQHFRVPRPRGGKKRRKRFGDRREA